jgi:hypothetical protein
MAAIQRWMAKAGQPSSKPGQSSTVDVELECEGYRYTGTMTEINDYTLTLILVYSLPHQGKELELRRRIDKVIGEYFYGALIYDHIRQVVSWRESVKCSDRYELSPDDIDDVIRLGVAAFDLLRVELADFMGLSAADARLAALSTAGSA